MREGVFPKRLEIEFTNRCNSRCIYCPRRYGIGEEGFMPLALFRKIIDEASRYPDTVLQLHRRGESLLHPDCRAMFAYVKGKFAEIQLATNGILLSGDLSEAAAGAVTFITFSIDLPERYAAQRGVDAYHQVEKNVIAFMRLGKGVRVQVSMVRDGSVSDRDVERFRGLWSGRVDRVRVYEEHSVGGVYGAVKEKRPRREPCTKPFTDMVIYWNGMVVRCNHDWSNKPLGDAVREPIAAIWKSEPFVRMREEQRLLRFGDDVCGRCDSWYAEAGVQGTGHAFSGKAA